MKVGDTIEITIIITELLKTIIVQYNIVAEEQGWQKTAMIFDNFSVNISCTV